ncbi:dihydropteroate synthase [Escherichia coli]
MNLAKTDRRAGATIIDVGGESTRPSAAGVCVEESCPVLFLLSKQLLNGSCWISVDTSKPQSSLSSEKQMCTPLMILVPFPNQAH